MFSFSWFKSRMVLDTWADMWLNADATSAISPGMSVVTRAAFPCSTSWAAALRALSGRIARRPAKANTAISSSSTGTSHKRSLFLKLANVH